MSFVRNYQSFVAWRYLLEKPGRWSRLLIAVLWLLGWGLLQTVLWMQVSPAQDSFLFFGQVVPWWINLELCGLFSAGAISLVIALLPRNKQLRVGRLRGRSAAWFWTCKASTAGSWLIALWCFVKGHGGAATFLMWLGFFTLCGAAALSITLGAVRRRWLWAAFFFFTSALSVFGLVPRSTVLHSVLEPTLFNRLIIPADLVLALLGMILAIVARTAVGRIIGRVLLGVVFIEMLLRVVRGVWIVTRPPDWELNNSPFLGLLSPNNLGLVFFVALAVVGLAVLGWASWQKRPRWIAGGLFAVVLAVACVCALIGKMHVVRCYSALEGLTEYKIPPYLSTMAIVCGAAFVLVLVFLLNRFRFTFFTAVSVDGVLIGTMALVIVLSVMGGFETDMRKRILGSNAHVRVTKEGDDPFIEYRDVAKKIAEVKSVVAQTPFLETEVVIAAKGNYQNVMVRGVDPQTVGKVTELEKNLRGNKRKDGIRKLWPLHPDGTVREGPPDPRNAPSIPAHNPAGSKIPSEDAGVDSPPDDFGVPTTQQPTDFTGGAPSAAEPASAVRDAIITATPSAKLAKRPGSASHLSDQDLDAPPSDFEAPGASPPIDFSGDEASGEPEIAAGDEQLDGLAPDAGAADGSIRIVEQFGLPEVPEDVDWPEMSVDPTVAVMPGVLVGSELAKEKLSLYVGQEVNLISPLGQETPAGPVPRKKPFRVAGIFYTGHFEYDLKSTYVELGALQDFLNMGDEVTGIDIRLRDVNLSGEAKAELHQLLGSGYLVQDWQDLNRSLFSALKLEQIAMFMVLGIVILVASFSIIGNLVMMVVEKQREIAVFKTLGARDTGVLRIFVVQGLMIGLIGTVQGIGLGLLASMFLQVFGFPIQAEVYYVSRLPVHVDPWSVFAIFVAGIAISIVATLYPAYLAARVKPVQGLRAG